MKTIPMNRVIMYGLLIGLLPLIFVIFSYISQRSQLEDLQSSVEYIRHQAVIKEKKQALNLSVRQHFREADHFYIDKQLETLTFLEQEKELLEKISNDKSFANDERIKKRLDFLTGSGGNPGNGLVFSEGVVQKFPLFQETVETLMHPVEINTKDLQKILAKIEGVEMNDASPGPNRPQLFITDFKLEKKTINEKNQVFQLNLKLVKREFL